MSSLGNYNTNIRDTFTSQNYNVNSNHPLTQSSQEYLSINKFVSVHSEDRDIAKFPNASEFEVELPEDYLNVAGIRLVQWTFPSNYNTFSHLNGNVNLSFTINNPYNPGENQLSNEFAQRIFEVLFLTKEIPYDFVIEEGFYNPAQITTEVQNKMNDAVSRRLLSYFKQNGWDDSITELQETDGYQRFVIAYHQVSLKLWFGNQADGFTILNELGSLVDLLSDDICSSHRNQVPDASNYGLPGFLGLPRCNTEAIDSSKVASDASLTLYNGIVVPRFYYGNVNGADYGYWLLPVTGFPNCNVYWIEAPYKLNVLGDAYIYMELAGQNCIDETQPWNPSKFTLTTNQTNGIVNSAFAKISVPATPLSQWFDRDSLPVKWYLPPAERIRRLRVKLRYHNGKPVDFGLFNYSFMLQFTLVTPQILRSSLSMTYPPS